MKKRYIQIKTPEGPKLVPKDEATLIEEARKGPFIFGDIEPYKAVTGDMQGKWITSRSQHREFLRRNNLIEVGNEFAQMTRHNGKSPDNPWSNYSEKRHEEAICRSLQKNLEILRSR